MMKSTGRQLLLIDSPWYFIYNMDSWMLVKQDYIINDSAIWSDDKLDIFNHNVMG